MPGEQEMKRRNAFGPVAQAAVSHSSRAAKLLLTKGPAPRDTALATGRDGDPQENQMSMSRLKPGNALRVAAKGLIVESALLSTRPPDRSKL